MERHRADADHSDGNAGAKNHRVASSLSLRQHVGGSKYVDEAGDAIVKLGDVLRCRILWLAKLMDSGSSAPIPVDSHVQGRGNLERHQAFHARCVVGARVSHRGTRRSSRSSWEGHNLSLIIHHHYRPVPVPLQSPLQIPTKNTIKL